MALFPLPPATVPIAATLLPVQQWYQYLQSLDMNVRALQGRSPNTQTGNYTLALMDAGGVVETNAAGSNNVTVPLNSAIPFAIGSKIEIRQLGAGATTIVATAGVTIRNRLGLVLGGQNAVAFIEKRGTDDWVAYGDLA